ncbi:MAG: NAD(P)H-dependent flavin oxidoreductase [Bacillota bacterium]
MQLSELKIGNLIAKIPIVQGGMAVRVSTAPLAAAVAGEGGIGLIGGSGMDVEELKNEIRRARELTSGIIGVNIMVAVRNFKDLVKASLEEKIDLIVAGAGFSRDLLSLGREKEVEVVPIVSSLKLARISEKLGASAVVVEGKEAGGHLGTNRSVKSLVEKITDSVSIPVIAAGGIVFGKDIAEMLTLGAGGVQLGSRFVTSEECEVDAEFKNKYIDASEDDSVLIESPVGLPGRALKNIFTERLSGSDGEKVNCNYLCLKQCSRRFCIMKALKQAHDGNMEKGLVFAGERAHLINKILPVKNIISDLVREAKNYLPGGGKDD